MIILYHGSDNLFKQFVFINVGKKHGTSGGGFGIYLTTSKEDAALYGKYCYTVEADLRKELSNRKLTLNKMQIRALLRKFESLSYNSYIENYEAQRPLNWSNEDKAIAALMKYNRTDVDLINDIINTTGGGIEMMQTLKSFGYTHSTDNLTPKDKTTTNYIIYDLDCLKIQKRENISDALADLYESILEDYKDPEDSSAQFRLEQLFNLAKFNIPYSNLDEAENIKTGTQGKAKSKSQRKLFAMALAYKRGKLNKKYASDAIKKMADSMSQETLHDFAATKEKKRNKDGKVSKRNNIPDYVKGSDYRPNLKNSKSLKPEVIQRVSKNNKNK